MPWARLAPEFHGHPKIVLVGLEAIGLYAIGLSYCADYSTDGFIPIQMVRRWSFGENGTTDIHAVADRLVRAELWEDVAGGYSVCNYLKYNVPRCVVKRTGDSRYRPSWWRRLRQHILERDAHTCQYCGALAEHVDHVKPRCQGGTDDPDNLVAACAKCNLNKSGRTPEEAGMTIRSLS